MAVDTRSNKSRKTEPHRQITAKLRGGTHSMRQAGEVYLPRQTRESETGYQNRLNRSVLTNYYTKTVDTFVGRIVKKPPKILESTPPQIGALVEDIDNQGNDLATFLREAITAATDDGIVYFYVDSPQSRVESEEARIRSMADDEAQGIRPFVTMIRAEQVLDIHYDDRQNLDLVRYSFTHTEKDPEDEFSTITRNRIRVIDLDNGRVRHRIYEKRKAQDVQGTTGGSQGHEWTLVETVSTEFTEIPLHAMYARKEETDVGMPLFMDLADLNILHWQSQSDQTNIEHVVRVPILFAKNLLDEETQIPQDIVIGPNSVVHGSAGSELTYVEHTGKGVEAGMKALQRLETGMVDMGTQIILNRTGNQTATARAIDQAEADNLMAAVATAAENSIQVVFGFLADALNLQVDDAGGIDLNKDFGIGTLDPQTAKMLTDLWKMAGLSLKTLLSEFQRHGVITEDLDLDLEIEAIEEDQDAVMRREAELAALEQPEQPEEPEDEDDEEDDEDADD
jgi:hypothetical protein